METGSGIGAPTKERSPQPNIAQRKSPQLDAVHHRTTKRAKKLKLSKRDIQSETETLRRCSVVSKSTFSTHIHKHSHRIQRKRKHRRKKSKLADTGSTRSWSYSTRDFSNCKDRIVFASYNILGVENALNHSDLYLNISPEYLDWDYRKRRMHKEIKKYKPGIICFQEVDRFGDLDRLLKEDGFRGVYKARTGEASDGCAIFWNNELFTLSHEESIEFQSFGLRNNVSQIFIFKMNENQFNTDMNSQTSNFTSSRSFLVGNIHALFNPSRGDIKLGQIRIFLEKAYTLSQEWGSIPVVIAGDFNSVPQSPMYQFLSLAELDVQQYDRKKISGQIFPLQYPGFQTKSNAAVRWNENELRLATGSALGYLRHSLKLFSAYAGVPGGSNTRNNFGEPLATSYHSKFMGTVDYIWHTGELLPVRVLETLSIDKLRETGGLPSKKWGSDHLALVCEFAFADDETEE